MRNAVTAGDIVRTEFPADISKHVNLYMGSGSCGACFDEWGLMHNGRGGEPLRSISNTTVRHCDHLHRGSEFNMDYWLPVYRLVWAEEPPPPPAEWRQELALYDGRLTTSFSLPGGRAELKAWFHPDRRDLLFVEISHEGPMPQVLLEPETTAPTHYRRRPISGTCETLASDDSTWTASLHVGTADSVVCLKVVSVEGSARLCSAPTGVSVGFEAGPSGRGRHLIVTGTAAFSRRDSLARDIRAASDPDTMAAEAVTAWRRRWGSGFIHVPHPEYQAMWARSLFYVLASCAPEVRSPTAPMGWACSMWQFHFPQDVSYIHPALLRLGHSDIARSWVEFYRERIDDCRSYTKRVYGAEGVMWPWEFPIAPGADLFPGGVAPNIYQYEIHNAAYPARMATEAALHLRDSAWTREVAWPVVRESARFYGSVLKKNRGGKWGIRVVPSMGQDEAGGPDGTNYLCALYSARYTLLAALAMSAELEIDEAEHEMWRAVLDDGLAFDRLYDGKSGLCETSEEALASGQIGSQKHPVQLNPLVFLPTGKLDRHVEEAYKRRHELCVGDGEDMFYGWTLGALWLAASHMEDPAAVMAELGRIIPGRYADPDWIQFYETSGAIDAPFYVTTHGLYLQALTDAVVSDYWRELRVGAAVPDEWSHVRFGGLRTADGNILSGSRVGADWKVEMEVPRPASDAPSA